MPADVLPAFTCVQRVTIYLLFTLLERQIYKVSLKEIKVYIYEGNLANSNAVILLILRFGKRKLSTSTDKI